MSNGNDDNTKANSEDGLSQVNNQLVNTQVASQGVTRGGNGASTGWV